MAEIPFTVKSAEVRNAYRDGANLLLQMDCSLPDICVACGQPAWGNVIHKEFNSRLLWLLLAPLFDFIYLALQQILGKRYAFDFPFCPNCPPDRFQLKPIRLTCVLAIFEGACQPFLELLPFSPPSAGETRPYWFERKFRWLTYEEQEGPSKRSQS